MLVTLGGSAAGIRTLAGYGPFTCNVVATVPTDKVTYQDGTIEIVDGNGATFYSAPARFRGRGNSTWAAPKKPFKVRSLDRLQRPFGMAASRDWALMADYYDQSYLRSALGYELARRASGRWTPHSTHVFLNWNGTPQGIYRLSETADLQAGRVDFRAMVGGDVAGNEVTGPYLLETDDYFDKPGFTTAAGTPVMYDAPDGTVAAQATYIQTWTQAFESALLGSDESVMLAYVDLPSWVDWYLLQELVRNQDADTFKSIKWVKDQDAPAGSGKMILWPPWDLDMTLGYGGHPATGDWIVRAEFRPPLRSRPNWLFHLWSKSPTFRAACRAAWTTRWAPAVAAISPWMLARAARIEPMVAADRAIWMGDVRGASDTAAGILTWLNNRAEWITANL